MYRNRVIEKKPCKHDEALDGLFCDNMPTIGMGGFCYKHEQEDPGYKRKQDRTVAKKSEAKLRFSLKTNATDQLGFTQSLINDIDIVFSNYIRLKFADEKGIVTCFVCDKPFFWKHIECGHYISRGNKETRFMEENGYPQCKWCNNLHNENKQPFKEAIEKYRPGTTDFLEELSMNRAVYKFEHDQLGQLLIQYREKLKFVQSKLLINQKP